MNSTTRPLVCVSGLIVPLQELALAKAEIRHYASELRLGHSRRAGARWQGRETKLWNAAANDEVHVKDGHLMQAVPFPARMHEVDDKLDSDALAPRVRSMVAAAGSEVAALATAARKEEELKKELRAQERLAAGEQVVAASQKLQQEVDEQELQHQKLLRQVQAQEAQNNQARARNLSEADLEQVEVAEDPAKLEKCLENVQKATRESSPTPSCMHALHPP